MRLNPHTATTIQLTCTKGGEGEVHEFLPSTCIMRDCRKPQGSGTFLLPVPQLSREEILGLEVPHSAIRQ